MTTIIATKNKILSDGKMTSGDRVDSLNFKKVRKIHGYLVGGAGRVTSITAFFDWFENYVVAKDAQEALPKFVFSLDPTRIDEDFYALVVHPDGSIYIHEGNEPNRALLLEEEYATIGSGADYALAALDAGATPEEAMEIAKKRDAFSGGETFVEELPEYVDLTEEYLAGLSKEQLLNLLVDGVVNGETGKRIIDENTKELKVEITQEKAEEFKKALEDQQSFIILPSDCEEVEPGKRDLPDPPTPPKPPKRKSAFDDDRLVNKHEGNF